MSDSATTTDYLDLTAKIVMAHVGHNAVTPDALPNLIEIVYRSLAATDAESPSASGPARKPKPEKSASEKPNAIRSLGLMQIS